MFRVPKVANAAMPAATASPLGAFAKATKEYRRCSYLTYECNQPCLDSYSYCAKHILEDPNAPFKQCCFIYNVNGRKCQNIAPKTDRRDSIYCMEHTRKAQIAKTKTNVKHTLPESPETLLLNLRHYVRNLSSIDLDVKPDDEEDENEQVDAYEINSRGHKILNYASSSDSDVEPTSINDTVKGTYLEDSDNDSLHSAEEDPLRHAGVYTAEEVVYIAREKLMRLQSLYIDQFKRLQYVLREKRRKYMHTLKKEKETLCSIHDQAKETAKEQKIYEKLKALNGYHRRSGIEAILYKKSLERRALVTEGPIQKPHSVVKCIFTEGGVKCGERGLPSAKYCRKHILKDQNQVLFKACGAIEADTQCHEPVTVIFDSNCVFHAQVPKEIKLEPMKVREEKSEEQPPTPLPPPISTNPILLKTAMEIDISDNAEIDPDDDIAGIMREMNDVVNKKSNFSESIISEASTDTAFSLTQISDKDDLVNM